MWLVVLGTVVIGGARHRRVGGARHRRAARHVERARRAVCRNGEQSGGPGPDSSSACNVVQRAVCDRGRVFCSVVGGVVVAD